MKALRDLRRFILVKCAEGNQSDVRSYVAENIASLALAFRVPPQTIIDSMDDVLDDGALATRLLETVLRAESLIRERQRESRARNAQASADALASAVTWECGRALIDVPSLLSSALTRRDDLLVFTGDAFTVGVHMAPLLDLSKLQRVRADLSGYVDRDGLHLRWRTGGLNLRPRVDARAAKVVLHLPSPPAVVAA